MLTVIIKTNAGVDDVQLTQKSVLNELWHIPQSEMLTVSTWREGLRQVRTMYVCLLEGDCTLSSNYLVSNYGIMKKSLTEGREGGNARLAMLSSCIGIETFDDRIYHYRLEQKTTKNITDWQVAPYRDKDHSVPYEAQIGFVPGAMMRFAAIKDIIDSFSWDDRDRVKMSTKLAFYFWEHNRMLQVNPNTTYIVGRPVFPIQNPNPWNVRVPYMVGNIYQRLGL